VVRLVLFAAVLVSGVAQAQPWLRTVANTGGTSPVCVTWSHRDVTYVVDAAGSAKTPGDTEFVAIDAAFHAWQALSDGCSDFTFTAGPRVSNPQAGVNTPASNVVTFREKTCADPGVVPAGSPCLGDLSCANAFRCWDHLDTTIALTTVSYLTKSGVVTDADIELNAASFLFTTVDSPPCSGTAAPTCVATDLQNTMTHEIGHLVGFDHVGNPGSTMLATAPTGEISKRVIDPGTAEGFCSTYPKGEPPTSCDVTASHHLVGSGTCSSASGLSGWALLMTVLRHRRRRTR
jgi:hypothetical protein